MADFCSKIIVVGGHRLEELSALTREYKKVQVVFNKDYSSGMFSSVKEGVRRLQGRKFFLTPADCPLVKKEVYRALLQAQQDIAVPRYRGRKGHPIFMSSSLVPEILSEPDDSNLGNFIRRKGCETIDVEDENILLDIDTKEDYEKIKTLLDNAI
jgi:molybdenum cofactor cytidylyltransferase